MIKSLLKLIHEPVYARRIEVLASKIVPHLEMSDKVLDVGCGSGRLGEAVLRHADCPSGLTYRGLEKCRRGGEPIEVIQYKAGPLPFADRAFDVVILADVLHHEEREDFLLGEASRVSNRMVILKEHKPEGFLAHGRVCFLDWAANHPHDVPCLYRYRTAREWRAAFQQQGLVLSSEETSIDLYPRLVNWLFGRRLHYLAFLEPPGGTAANPAPDG